MRLRVGAGALAAASAYALVSAIFTAIEQAAPDAEVHVLDAGHFALDEKVDEIAGLIRSFLDRIGR